MTGKTTGYVSIMLVTAILGVMLAVQFRVVNRVQAGVSTDRAKEIVDELNQIDLEKESLHHEISDLNDKLAQVNQGQSEAVKALESELEKVRLSAGLVAATGPGVEVVLDNPEGGKGNGVFIIYAEDLLKVVNELLGSGAEAISINGQRITDTTEIRMAGSFININTKRVMPPFQILAIGDPDALANALELPGGVGDYLRSMGIVITVKKHQELTVPAFVGN
ncbi:MAG: DUF881 domain-containing protein [Firmicutes bacterium]|nr:DUF881 domain-containing protein [Bacillota bacterium]